MIGTIATTWFMSHPVKLDYLVVNFTEPEDYDLALLLNESCPPSSTCRQVEQSPMAFWQQLHSGAPAYMHIKVEQVASVHTHEREEQCGVVLL